ncbi:hypothetical protein ABIA39_005210 [Nocardia sp. GAS34]|uniref:MmyB family transcriptional regulator n=1 Tax=unclassified Nocardia TaxID=2637762 RepID=UPI003D244200
MLTALAGALRLNDQESNHLFRLAGRVGAADIDAGERLPAEAAAVPGLLQPHPAYIIDATYEVLAHNEAAEELFPNLVSRQEDPVNFVRWVFLEPEARRVLVDWESEARGLLARLRAVAARHASDPRFDRLIDDLNAGSPEMRAWWPRYDVQSRQGGRKRLRRRSGEVVEYAYTAFHLAEHPDHTLVIYSATR